jgi:hypothetical protein
MNYDETQEKLDKALDQALEKLRYSSSEARHGEATKGIAELVHAMIKLDNHRMQNIGKQPAQSQPQTKPLKPRRPRKKRAQVDE